jgi:FlaA1/EpsC-like NDP-sugar epimerase
MGEPVKIVDLAHNMIRLAGYEPEVDIAIEFVGARPGEKLHEELFNSDERPQPTASDRIVRAVRSAPLDPEWVNGTLTRLETMIREGDESDLAEQTVQLVSARRSTEVPVDDLTA